MIVRFHDDEVSSIDGVNVVEIKKDRYSGLIISPAAGR